MRTDSVADSVDSGIIGNIVNERALADIKVF